MHLAVDPAILPVKIPLRRVPVALQDKLTEVLEHLQQLGIITRIEEPTDWVSTLVVTEKKSGAIRVCLDPAHLNKSPHSQRFSSTNNGRRITSSLTY